MRVVERGVLSPARPGTVRAVAKAPALAALRDGAVLAIYRVGSDSDTDDSTVEIRRSRDGGRTWSDPDPLRPAAVTGHRGTHYSAAVTDLGDGALLLTSLWVDREAFPGRPLFNAETEGCLPMAIVLADSRDGGATWSDWRVVPLPDDVGPPSLTDPVMVLPSGRLALSLETNKTYLDASRWYQRVVYCYSSDRARTWTAPRTVSADPTGRIFNWDQRVAVWPDGRLASFSWTYDHDANRYLNIQRRVSADEGATWSAPEDLGVTDQAAHPAVLPDGRYVLAWVDRFGDRTIKARLADAIDAPLRPESEVTIHAQTATAGARLQGGEDPGELLDEMGGWTFGRPFGVTLPDGEVLVAYYAGRPGAIDIQWARIRP